MIAPTRKNLLLTRAAKLLGVKPAVIYARYGWDKLTIEALTNTYNLIAELKNVQSGTEPEGKGEI